MKKNIIAMTLVELIIAIAISSIVLLFVVVYISDVL
ncbi:MAG: prepilin-type N-terminal cleavage/methylation domain-containing protein [Patescibacteria group bacterium]